jgi:hypothetical protein
LGADELDKLATHSSVVELLHVICGGAFRFGPPGVDPESGLASNVVSSRTICPVIDISQFRY